MRLDLSFISSERSAVVRLRWLPLDFSDIVTEMGNIVQFMVQCSGCRLVGVKISEWPLSRVLLKGGVAIRNQLLAPCLLAPGPEIDCSSMCWYLLSGNCLALQSRKLFIHYKDVLITLNRNIQVLDLISSVILSNFWPNANVQHPMLTSTLHLCMCMCNNVTIFPMHVYLTH